jgi:hypothetical protein
MKSYNTRLPWQPKYKLGGEAQWCATGLDLTKRKRGPQKQQKRNNGILSRIKTPACQEIPFSVIIVPQHVQKKR